MTLNAEADEFITYCRTERRLSHLSLEAYRYDLTDFQRWRASNLAEGEITTENVKAYLTHMVSERQLSVATVRRRLACLRSLFRFLEEQHETENPFANWRPRLPRPKRLPRTLSRSEASAVLRSGPSTASFSSHGADLQTIIRLLIATGVRISELCRLTIDDVSPDGGTIHVRGKGSRDRIVFIADAKLRESLRQASSAQRRRSGATHLLSDLKGAELRSPLVRRLLRKHAREVGIERRITPHMLRHTAATLLIENGADIRAVQRLLGHASIATTEIYTHIADETLRTMLAQANVLGSLSPTVT